MFDSDSWQKVTVTHKHLWDEGLFTSTFDLSPDFKAGQFGTLALEVDGEVVKRAYSIASEPGKPLELFVVEVEGGLLSPRLFALEPGDTAWMRRKIAGLFTLDRVEPGGTLWLVCTGTGLAPYISMLRQAALYERWERVIVVHGVRRASQLAYRDELTALADAGRIVYLPGTSREPAAPGILEGRITTLFATGALEERAGAKLAAEGHHILLCGNPDMVVEMTKRLQEERGMALHRPRTPGGIHVERYW